MTDSYGIDPLQDKTIPSLMKLPLTRTHVVTASERGRPELISYREYGVVTLWWVVLLCNKIYRHKDLTEGTVLSLPEFAAISTAANAAQRQQSAISAANKAITVSF